MRRLADPTPAVRGLGTGLPGPSASPVPPRRFPPAPGPSLGVGPGTDPVRPVRLFLPGLSRRASRGLGLRAPRFAARAFACAPGALGVLRVSCRVLRPSKVDRVSSGSAVLTVGGASRILMRHSAHAPRARAALHSSRVSARIATQSGLAATTTSGALTTPVGSLARTHDTLSARAPRSPLTRARSSAFIARASTTALTAHAHLAQAQHHTARPIAHTHPPLRRVRIYYIPPV